MVSCLVQAGTSLRHMRLQDSWKYNSHKNLLHVLLIASSDTVVASLKQITLVFCAPDGIKSLESHCGRAAKQAMEMFCSTVRTTLNACKGYECQEKDGIFMLAFQDPVAAVEWACVLNLALMYVHWAPEVLSSELGKEVFGHDGVLLYRGVRARVGIYKVNEQLRLACIL